MDKRMARLRVAGKGSYGIVYIATEASNIKNKNNRKDISLRGIPEEELYAIKRNFKEKPTTGYGNLREADMMKILSGHPYIVNLIGIKHNDPFKNTARPMTPIGKTDFAELTEDKMLFVMEYLPYNGEEYILEKSCTPFAIKVLIMELLLAVEFIHSQGIVHRDIRTSNVLISVDDEGNHELKLCDFGLSRVMGDGKSTPGVVTSWYRGPEVNCCAPYNRKADMWSVGCVIYEFVCGKALLKGTEDKDEDIFNAILSKLATTPDQKVIDKLFESGSKLKIHSKSLQSSRIPFVSRMKLSSKFKSDFESVPGTLDQLEDLLQSLLCLDPDTRISATRALDHPFFDWTREHITQIRKDFPPEPPPLPFYTIEPCIERTWVANLAFTLFNARTKSDRIIAIDDEVDSMYIPKKIKSWYSHRILFHALDLFDQYIVYRLNDSTEELRDRETELLGRIDSKEETYLYFYTCLYMMHKYYSTLQIPSDWDTFAPEIFSTIKNKRKVTEFEMSLVDDILGNKIFRKTLIEISAEYTTKLTENMTRDLLFKLGTMRKPWIEKSVRALYRKFNNIPSPGAIDPGAKV